MESGRFVTIFSKHLDLVIPEVDKFTKVNSTVHYTNIYSQLCFTKDLKRLTKVHTI